MASANTSADATETMTLTMSGWLEKQAEWKLEWRDRLVTATGRTISYREAADLPDKGAARVQAMQKGTGHDHCFRLWTELGEIWLLRTKTYEDWLRWTNYLEYQLTHDDPRLVRMSGEVEKRGAWTGSWRQRYVQLEGVEFRYAEKEGKAEKKRYVVASADRCKDPLEIRIGATDGDTFNIRLSDSTMADAWFRALRVGLMASWMNRWQSPPMVGDKVHQARLGSSFHSFARLDECHIITFGGVTYTMPSTTPRPELNNTVTVMTLTGEHRCAALAAEPHQDKQGVKVKPMPREAAASTFVDGVFYIHGGCDFNVIYGELWKLDFGSPSLKLQWERVFSSNKAIPALCGHTASAHGPGKLLFCGGYGNDGKASSNAYVVSLADMAVSQLTMDQPRARHSAVRLADGSDRVVLVGGLLQRGATDGLSSVSVFEPGSERFHEVDVEPRLPPMIAPALHSTEKTGGAIFVLGGDGGGLPSLYLLQPQLADNGKSLAGFVCRTIECLGACPRVHFGMSLFSSNGFLYAVGDGALPPAGTPTVRRVLLPELAEIQMDAVQDSTAGATEGSSPSDSAPKVAAVSKPREEDLYHDV